MIMTTAETAQDRVIDWWANSSKRPAVGRFQHDFQ